MEICAQLILLGVVYVVHKLLVRDYLALIHTFAIMQMLE